MLITSHYYYSIKVIHMPDWLVNCLLLLMEIFEMIGVRIKCHAGED